ncbi:transcriptional regulator MerR family [Clostridium sp. CAG:1013]|nr:transcriptional regulator MerR family [Clostridium sp. CAG:1013]
MSLYTTGEMAKLAGVSVRTVQFYDGKGLLPPSQLSEGGRRLYSQEDLGKLQRICLWKTMGLSLDSIKGILESQNADKVLGLLLEQQAAALEEDIQDRQRQLQAIRALEENLKSAEKIPVNSISDMEQLMKNKKKLRKIHGVMIAWGVLMDLLQIAGLVLWIVKGIWLPFVVCFAVSVVIGVLLTRYYYRNTEYLCPACGTRFKPSVKEFLFSKHTPKTRKLTCSHCGTKDYCVEVAAP